VPRKENCASSFLNKIYWTILLSSFYCSSVLVKHCLIDLLIDGSQVILFNFSLSLWIVFGVYITDNQIFYAISLSFVAYLLYSTLHYFHPFILAIFLMKKGVQQLSAWFFYLIVIRLLRRFKHPSRKLRVLSPST